ncbi:GTP cyclohydrolase 1 type 2/Nif3 [Xylaria bambusicola]|uniref:GTP cyclohydrolase 1 type 2/Nif3 n=1 Tax=Xylaria bambusicola TaxID=326684 RepID=UPI002008AAF7|nr:GTP cyclohydrolase 1 type 2/Nif3 [Xylaria bambusicola]KAI0525985.1 GTP cyclohydrolase 1 type 2/Nif3 [Xylaria bambusicola]
MATSRFRLVFHVPPSAAAACKSAIFAAGAGQQGNYSECCFTTALGTGQFRPTAGANPAIGKVGVLEEVEELCVETLCVGEETTMKAVAALKTAHPYEEPSYSVYRLEDF